MHSLKSVEWLLMGKSDWKGWEGTPGHGNTLFLDLGISYVGVFSSSPFICSLFC